MFMATAQGRKLSADSVYIFWVDGPGDNDRTAYTHHAWVLESAERYLHFNLRRDRLSDRVFGLPHLPDRARLFPHSLSAQKLFLAAAEKIIPGPIMCTANYQPQFCNVLS